MRPLDGSAPKTRELCARCRRPLALCYCSHLPSLETKTRVVILQHPRESRVPIGTARMAHLALPNSELHTGIEFDAHPRVCEIRGQAGTALLFPGEGALDPASLAPGAIKHLIVIDGTWAQARKVLKLNPALHELPRVGLKPQKPGNYRIRREPSAECLATIEAISAVLAVLEPDPQGFARMLDAFTFMVDEQLKHMSLGTPSRAHKTRNRPPSKEAALFENLDRIVFLHADVNAHARRLAVPGAPEMLHLAARRSSGEMFEAVLAPRRPLADNAARHLGLDEQRILDGESLMLARDRFRAFLREDDLFCEWGHFSSDQLSTEKFSVRQSIDLRFVVARRLQARPGSPEEALRRLQFPSLQTASKDRGGQVLDALAQIVRGLREKPEAPRGVPFQPNRELKARRRS